MPDEVLGDAEVFFPRARVNRAGGRAESDAAQRAGGQGGRDARAACKRGREHCADEAAKQSAPGGTLASRQLIALIDPELSLVVAVHGNRVAQIDDPGVVHFFEGVENLGRPIHVLLESHDNQFSHLRSPSSLQSLCGTTSFHAELQSAHRLRPSQRPSFTRPPGPARRVRRGRR